MSASLQELNTSLHRKLAPNSAKFDALFNTSNCEPTYLGEGDTLFTINNIQDCIYNQFLGTINTSQAKKLFGSKNIQKTCIEIHQFLYNNFQYDADGFKQHLRSPNCSWASRHQGIDCKSYTIIASVLLIANNVKHYLRRIKQPLHNPGKWSHIYVVVPNDQTKGDLSKGYYTIDGTIPYTTEPMFSQKHDIYMNLPHYALLGAATSSNEFATNSNNQQQGLSVLIDMLLAYGATDSYVKQVIGTITSNITRPETKFSIDHSGIQVGLEYFPFPIEVSTAYQQHNPLGLNGVDVSGLWNSVGGFFGSISCWGGSAYPGEKVEPTITNIFKYFGNYIDQINEAVKNNNMTQLSSLHVDFIGYATVASLAYQYKGYETNWNKCTRDSLTKTHNATLYILNSVYKALMAWLNEHHQVTPTGQQKTFDIWGHLEKNHGFYFSGGPTTHIVRSLDINTFKRKENTSPIKEFEFTEPLKEAAQNPSGFNTMEFLNSLSTVIVDVVNSGSGSNSSGSGTTSGSASGGTTSTTDTPPKPPTKTGMSTSAKVALGAGGLIAAYFVAQQIKPKSTPKTTA